MDLQNNAFHLDLSVMAKDGTVACPAGVIGFEKSQQGSEDIDVGSCAVLAVPDLQVLLRVHDFSMGTFSPSLLHSPAHLGFHEFYRDVPKHGPCRFLYR